MSIGRREFIRETALGAGLGMLAGAKGARAAETSPEQGSFTFAVVADPHCSEPPKPRIEQYGTGQEKFSACLKEMEKLEAGEKPDFILVVGDIHVAPFAEAIAETDIPIHAIAGNHEGNMLVRKQLREMFPDDFNIGGVPSDYYAFVHKGVRFIGMCDAGNGGEHIGQLCSEIIIPRGQCEWLEAQFKEPEARKILFSHIPPEPDGLDSNSRLSRNDSRWFNEVVKREKPEAMFFGHLHFATEEYKIGGTRCFNVRSCCWNFHQTPIGFMLVNVGPDSITTREIDTGVYAT